MNDHKWNMNGTEILFCIEGFHIFVKEDTLIGVFEEGISLAL